MVSQLLSSSMRFSQSSWADVKKIGRNMQCLVRHRLTMGPPLLPPHSIDNRSYTPIARDVGYHAVSKNSVIFSTRFEHAGHSFSHLLSFTGLRLLIECPWLSLTALPGASPSGFLFQEHGRNHFDWIVSSLDLHWEMEWTNWFIFFRGKIF